MQPFKFILALAILAILAYGVYAYWQSSNVPKTIDIGSAVSFKSIPATECTLKNDAGTITGTLYVFHDAARFDITSVVNGAPISVHVINSNEDLSYYWVDGQKQGSKGDYGPVYQTVGLGVLTQINCGSWWLPNGVLFIVPADVSFAQ